MQRLNMDIMQNMEHKTPLANNHISVDCVVIGFDGEQLKVLLIKRVGEEQGEIFHDMKLPGSLIYMDEDLDEAAQRVLNELTGLKNVNLMQFKAFGSKNRTKDPKDIHWLERAMQSRVERIVTIAYLSLVKIDRALSRNLADFEAYWVALQDIKALAFDHNLIIKEALVYSKPIDVRNFHKKIAMMEYVVPLEEKQQGVAHRAARYYRFDKKIYNKVRR